MNNTCYDLSIIMEAAQKRRDERGRVGYSSPTSLGQVIGMLPIVVVDLHACKRQRRILTFIHSITTTSSSSGNIPLSLSLEILSKRIFHMLLLK